VSHDGIERRLRAQLRTLAEEIQPSPDRLQRLPSRLRAARRRRVAGSLAAACLTIAVAVAVVRVLPLASTTPAIQGSSSPPRTFLSDNIEPKDPGGRQLGRYDVSTGRRLAVVSDWGVHRWQLLDDGSVVVEATLSPLCDTSLARILPDGQRRPLGKVGPTSGGGDGGFAFSADAKLVAAAGLCPTATRLDTGTAGRSDGPRRIATISTRARLAVYPVGATIGAKPLSTRTVDGRVPGRPVVSADGHHVAFLVTVTNTNHPKVEALLLDLSGAQPSWRQVTLRPDSAACQLQGSSAVLDRHDPSLLLTTESCGAEQRLVLVDLRNGQARTLLQLGKGTQAGLDLDASRSYLLVTTWSARRDGGIAARLTTYRWDGGSRLQPLSGRTLSQDLTPRSGGAPATPAQW